MIPIQNIYYMLSYAFQTLKADSYSHMETEEFNNVADLCAAILCRGVTLQIKRGLGREYMEKTEPLSALRGRIDMGESIKTRSMTRQQLVCTYDDFTVNYPLNQIIKTTMELLLQEDVDKARKKELRKLLVYFNGVDSTDIHTINWSIQYHRNNETYRLLIFICQLVIKGRIQANTDGVSKLLHFTEEHMHRLYEKFILEYYRREHKELKATASQIPWALDDGIATDLPIMQSDIMLTKGNQVLIIDAKYYSHTMQNQYGANTIHSANLYQIFTYVKNKEQEFNDKNHTVSGMLLYARTDEQAQPDGTYQMSGNKISVKTLDLNCTFKEIAKQLDEIAFSINNESGRA